MKKDNPSRYGIKADFILLQCVRLSLLYLLFMPLEMLHAQSHDLKYDPLSLLDHKLLFAYEYIPKSGKWGMELSWERYGRSEDSEAVSFPGKPSWGDFIVSIDNYKKRYNGMNFQLKRYFSNNGKGLRQYLGLNLYHEDETKISFKPRSLNTEKIYELEKASSLQGFSLGLNFGYKVLIHQHWLIEPQGSMRFLLLPSSSAQIGGGKAMFVLKCGYRL